MEMVKLNWLSKDGKIILLTRMFRSFAFGFISIVIGIYLQEIGISSLVIGLLLSASILGGAVFTILTGHYAFVLGIKKMFLFSLVVSLIGISVFIFTENYIFLLIASLIAFISPSGRELGPFLSLEQAYLPSTVSARNRTKAFSFLSMVSHLAASLGALIGFMPSYLQNNFGLEKVLSYKMVFAFYFILNLFALLLYTRISDIKFEEKNIELSKRTKKIVAKLSLLFSVDSFAGGFVVGSIISLWFHTKFNVPLSTISIMFFIAGLLETLSFYLSGKLAEKIGLINTMVFTHIPGSICLILMSFMPTFYLAGLFYMLRQLLSEMDIPARQSYVVSVVSPEERPQAASITSVARLVSSSISPAIAGKILLLPFLSPFVIAGTLKIFYDLTLFFSFKHIKPNEEEFQKREEQRVY